MEEKKKQHKESYIFMASAFGVVLGLGFDKVVLGLIFGFLIGLYLDINRKSKK